MKHCIPINLAAEDLLSEAILRKMINHTRRPFCIGSSYCRGGIGYLKRMLPGFNRTAKGMPFLVLIDLDRAECAPAKLSEYLPGIKHHNLLLRIAVKEVESWLLADRVNFARFLGISKDTIPSSAEGIVNPKEMLINLARRSRKRILREDIIPLPGSTAKIGPNYNGCLIRFVNDLWDISHAIQSSPSLSRTMKVLQNFRPVWEKS
jgi:hypothetical protein